MSSHSPNPSSEDAVPISLGSPEQEIVSLFVSGAQALGLPKSHGEIYGILFVSPDPLTMEDITEHLGISIGSVSQGLKQLKNFHAVKTVYIPGNRRDHFIAEDDFKRLVGAFVSEEIQPHLDSAHERLTSIREKLPESDSTRKEFLESRLSKLESWRKNGSSALKASLKFLNILRTGSSIR